MSQKIKPCPFCGSEDTDCNSHFVSCNDCHAIGPEEPLPDRDWVIQRWNRRPLEEAFEERELATSVVIGQRDAEILRLKNLVAELEKPDMFRLADPDPYTPSTCFFKEILDGGDTDYLVPYEIECASSRPTIWAVKNTIEEKIEWQSFYTEAEAQQFCQKIKEANHGDT